MPGNYYCEKIDAIVAAAIGWVYCPYCGAVINERGLTRHVLGYDKQGNIAK